MKFNLVHIAPEAASGLAHGLLGYREVVETMQWGFGVIGVDATMTMNRFVPDRTNIVLGSQVLGDSELRRLPADTIVYNFEQIARMPADRLKPQIQTVAQRFRVWDYSEGNIETWRAMGTRYPVTLVPVGWAPILDRIDSSVAQDIDVLIYGTPGQTRLEVFYDLCLRGLKCVFLCGLYGKERDEFIARSKLVLNVNLLESRVFEIVRVSYLLANAKAVVADSHPDMVVEPDMQCAVAFAEPRHFADRCQELLGDDAARRALELRGRDAIQRRPIAPILRAAIDRLPAL